MHTKNLTGSIMTVFNANSNLPSQGFNGCEVERVFKHARMQDHQLRDHVFLNIKQITQQEKIFQEVELLL